MIELTVPEVTDSEFGRQSLDEYRKALATGLAFIPIFSGSPDTGLEIELMAIIPADEVRFLDGNLIVGLKLRGIKELRDACDEILTGKKPQPEGPEDAP